MLESTCSVSGSISVVFSILCIPFLGHVRAGKVKERKSRNRTLRTRRLPGKDIATIVKILPTAGTYFCTSEGCSQKPQKLYHTLCRLRYGKEGNRVVISRILMLTRKHAHHHFPPLQCPECSNERAEQKDMKRHVQDSHPKNAETLGTGGETLTYSQCGMKPQNSHGDNL